MSRINNKRDKALKEFDINQYFTLKEASSIVKKITSVNFDATVDISIKLGVKPIENPYVILVLSFPGGARRFYRFWRPG